MSINNSEELLKHCLATMMVCETAPLLKDHLIALFDKVILPLEAKEGSNDTDEMRQQIATIFEEIVDEMPIAKPDDVDLKELSKCYGAFLWCQRTVAFIDEAKEEMEAMAAAYTLKLDEDTADFQENNR